MPSNGEEFPTGPNRIHLSASSVTQTPPMGEPSEPRDKKNTSDIPKKNWLFERAGHHGGVVFERK